jgi:hypothetical protein
VLAGAFFAIAFKNMKKRYRLIRRGTRGDTFYCVDAQTGKRTSLQTANETEGRLLVDTQNQALLSCFGMGKTPHISRRHLC